MGAINRVQILSLSVICCLFGAVAIFGPGRLRGAAYVINFLLAVILAIVAGRDLHRRGFRLGWLVGLSYLLAPLVGLVLYGIFSVREPQPQSAIS